MLSSLELTFLAMSVFMFVCLLVIVSNVVDGQVFVRARCYPSQRKNEEPHKLEV